MLLAFPRIINYAGVPRKNCVGIPRKNYAKIIIPEAPHYLLQTISLTLNAL